MTAKHFIIIFFGIVLVGCSSSLVQVDMTLTKTPTITISPNETLIALQTLNANETQIALFTPTPIPPTTTPTQTPIVYPVFFQTSLPESTPISPDNAEHLRSLTSFERTGIDRVDFTDDGRWLILHSINKVSIYDGQTFELKREFTPGGYYYLIPGHNWVVVKNTVVWDLDADAQKYAFTSAVKAVSNDGTYGATEKEIVKLADGSLFASIKGTNPQFSPNNKEFAIVDAKNVVLYDLNNLAMPLAKIPYPSEAVEYFFSTDGTVLFTRVDTGSKGDFSRDVRLYAYDVPSGSFKQDYDASISRNMRRGTAYFYQHGNDLEPNGACYLYVSRIWPTLKLAGYEIPSKLKVCQEGYPLNDKYNQNYNPDAYQSGRFFNNVFAVGTYAGDGPTRTFRMDSWDMLSGKALLSLERSEPIIALGISKNSDRFAVYAKESGILEIVATDGTILHHFENLPDWHPAYVSLSPDNRMAALLFKDNVIVIDKNQTFQHIYRPADPSLYNMTGMNKLAYMEMRDARFMDNNKKMLLRSDSVLWLLDLTTDTVIKKQPIAGGGLSEFLMLPDGITGFIPSMEGGVDLYDFSKMKRIQGYEAPGKSMGSAALSPDGKWLALSGQANPIIYIFDVQTARVKKTFEILKFTNPTMSFSQDGKLLLVADAQGSRNLMQFWNLETGQMEKEIPISARASAIQFSPDGSFFVMATFEGRLMFWHLNDASPFLTLDHFMFSWQGARLRFLDQLHLQVDTQIYGIPELITLPPSLSYIPPANFKLYDDFSSPMLDSARWYLGSNTQFNVSTQNGALLLSNDGRVSKTASSTNLTTQKPGDQRSASTLDYFESRMMLIKNHTGDKGELEMRIPNSTGNGWFTKCDLRAAGEKSAVIVCWSASEQSAGKWSIDFSTEEIPATYNSWYSIRIEVDDQFKEIRYYVNGAPIGSYAPEMAADLATQKFYCWLGINAEPNTPLEGLVDGVYLTP